ncbi:hypothetical protein AUP42_14185 [Thalassospira lucentensis]|uniref:Uncharacterized protein n=1 Tax=Thalassospira lucentensis TaxID=168935 RepID=A0A154L816_9PROT|nr:MULTISPECIES: hypothetical protein [Thalassospira]KZB66689.1 hypothetical protein AUP42_14185 [Thalassospira lucentensis]MCH2273311.1 hypothetical protein [Thalassospira sp.]
MKSAFVASGPMRFFAFVKTILILEMQLARYAYAPIFLDLKMSLRQNRSSGDMPNRIRGRIWTACHHAKKG